MSDILVDTRGMEPPEPFEHAMEALAALPPQGRIVLLIDRMPYPLLRLLDRDGFRHEAQVRDDNAVEIRIFRP
ncbi:MAG: DUF2249 domain-containing protein [Thauera sp.]|nr:DUF2249 domain-containing protein [Thauera sp.]